MVFNLLDLIGLTGLDLVWDIVAFFISLILVLMVVQINAAIEKSGKGLSGHAQGSGRFGHGAPHDTGRVCPRQTRS